MPRSIRESLESQPLSGLVLEIACLSTELATGAAAEGDDGVCADATAVKMVSDRTVAQNVIDRMIPLLRTRPLHWSAVALPKTPITGIPSAVPSPRAATPPRRPAA